VSDSQDVDQMARITRRTDARPVGLAVYEQLDVLLTTLGQKDWAAQTACPGWSVADMVGHLIGAARGNASAREFTLQQLWGLRHRGDFGGNPLDAVNGLQIADHAGLPDARRAEALREVAPLATRGRMRWSAWFGAMSVPLSTGGSAASGMPRSVNLGRLLDVVYTRDVWMHTLDIAEAVGRPPSLSSPVNARVVQDVVLDWVRRHRQPVDLILTGAAGGRYRYGAGSTALEMDAVEFCRTLSGRSPGDGLLKIKVLF
jgi:uncharacterized protein (TIGR03083 family)